MAPEDLSALSEDELVAENQRLMAARDEIRGQQLAIKDELNARDIKRRAENLASSLSDAEREALGEELGLNLDVPAAVSTLGGTSSAEEG